MPDTDLQRAIEQLQQMSAREASSRPWYEIQLATGTKRALVRIYDVIGGWFGTSARDFAAQLDELQADEIELRLNSPGGNAWDGLAIYNALRAHPASVEVNVDGMAASAASIVAMAGDTIRMHRGSQMMIHDAGGVAMGQAVDMEKMAEVLNKISNSAAEIYAAKAGGTVDEWRAAMKAESWYTAQEAVDAGLADEYADAAADANASMRFDLSQFAYAYAGRSAAPPPQMLHRRPAPQTTAPATTGAVSRSAPVTAADAARQIHAASQTTAAVTAAASPRKEGAGLMDPAKIREGLGLAPDASDDEVRQAIMSAGLVTAPASPPTPAGVQQTAEPSGETAPRVPAAPAGVIMLDPAQYEALRQQAVRGDEAWRQLRENECEAVLDAAIKAGKFPPSRRDHWKELWAKDPDGTKKYIEQLASNVIPVSASGYMGVSDATEVDMVYAAMFGEKAGAHRG